MEWFGAIRYFVWHNAGFGRLRTIRAYIEEYEPRFDPTVIPLPSSDQGDAPTAERAAPKAGPVSHYYSVADYHGFYISGELTPTAVAKALLPLIRRDTSPPGEHSVAWYDTKVDRVLRAAEASTQRYKEKRPLGPLDGVPTAVKDEYEMEGYKTCLGSRNNYTTEQKSDGTTTSWCVRKLEHAGALILGKLNMHEFGLGIMPFKLRLSAG
jgi:Amidase